MILVVQVNVIYLYMIVIFEVNLPLGTLKLLL